MKIVLTLLLLVLTASLHAEESTCYGTTSNGRLEQGVRLPTSGPNFTSYGTLPELAGRTYVHSKVRDVIVAAYRSLEAEQLGKVFKYAETGFEEGGQFRPHKTHRNGLSVDSMLPVINDSGESIHLPTNVLNRYGYDIDFDSTGRYEEYRIDFDALGAHIVALDKAAQAQGVGIWRVVFDPGLQPYLYKTRYGDYIKKHIEIPEKRSWVRHDEHYHVDFIVDCKPM